VATPLSQRELDALSENADRFIAELDEEAYLHFAGHKETYDLVPIYERHEELTKLETAQAIGASVNGGRNVRELWRFACEGYLGNFVSEEEEKVAEAETKTVKVGDEEIPYRDLRPRIGNETDRAIRQRLVRRSGSARKTTRSSTAASASRSTNSPTSAAGSSTRPRRCGRTPATASSAAGSGSGSARWSAGTSRACSAAPSGTPPSPRTRWCPRSR
jgi:hypothetical protein